MPAYRVLAAILFAAAGYAATPHFSAPNNGACSAQLPDGRSFLTGARNASYFERDGRLRPVSPMLEARSGHVCVAFTDGSVFVAGGDTGSSGATNSAEIYHPDTNSWTATAAMLTARTGAAAILLKNGKVLVAGGEAGGAPANTLEIYDPAQGRFEQAPGILSAPRSKHAIAVLDNGSVVIAGGFEGSQALDSVDLYDPDQNRVTPAGRMTVPRANFTASRLPGGKVLFAGGTDGSHELASAEVFDPVAGSGVAVGRMSIARQGHVALRAPGSDEVLIAAGNSGGRIQESGEYFVPGMNAFLPAADGGGAQTGAIVVGIVGPEMQIRSSKSYRLRALPGR